MWWCLWPLPDLHILHHVHCAVITIQSPCFNDTNLCTIWQHTHHKDWQLFIQVQFIFIINHSFFLCILFFVSCFITSVTDILVTTKLSFDQITWSAQWHWNISSWSIKMLKVAIKILWQDQNMVHSLHSLLVSCEQGNLTKVESILKVIDQENVFLH